MNNEIRIPVRLFPLVVKDERTGQLETDTIVLTKEQLHACQLVGQSATELIFRIFNRLGFCVIDVGKPVKKEIPVDIYSLQGQIIVDGDVIVDPGAEHDLEEEGA